MDNPPPVRFRIVLEVTFPEADPWDASQHMDYVDQLQFALETANNLKCTDVRIRDSGSIGTEDDYERWRGGLKYDFSNLTPAMGEIFGQQYPVATVDSGDVGRVWQVLSKAEAGELKENVAIAVGRAIKTDSDSNAVLARTYVLRVLQAKKLVRDGFGEDLLVRAASIPLRSAPMNESDLTTLAALFQ
jgi:hypothetical protein